MSNPLQINDPRLSIVGGNKGGSMTRWELDATMEPASQGKWVEFSMAQAEIDHRDLLLRRAAEAIDMLVDPNEGANSESERDWIRAQGEGVVADIRNALRGQDE